MGDEALGRGDEKQLAGLGMTGLLSKAEPIRKLSFIEVFQELFELI